jgi:hypothetical protein
VDGRTPTPYRARPRDLAGSQGTVWGRDDDGAEGDPVQITDRGGARGREFRDETLLMVAHRDQGGPWPPNVDEAFAPGACVAEPRNEDGLTYTFVQEALNKPPMAPIWTKTGATRCRGGKQWGSCWKNGPWRPDTGRFPPVSRYLGRTAPVRGFPHLTRLWRTGMAKARWAFLASPR